MEAQIEDAITELPEILKTKAFGDFKNPKHDQFVDDIIELVNPLILHYGQQTNNLAIKLILGAGLSTELVKRFNMTPEQTANYLSYIKKVARGYEDYTGEQIREILKDSILAGDDAETIKEKLRDVLLGKENEYRVDRLSRTEITLAEGKAGVYSMKNIADETGYKIYKEWKATGGDPCEYCQTMHGTRTEVHNDFLPVGGSVVGVNGGTMINNFADVESANLHPNCECAVVYKVEG